MFSIRIPAVLSVIVIAAGFIYISAQENSNVTAIQNVTVFDATGRAPFSADVIIRDGRFSAIGTDIDIPAGAKILDGSGLSILPGLIDVHVHWTTMDGASRADIATQMLLSGVTTSTDFHSAPESFAPKRAWHRQLISPHVIYTARTATPGGHGADWGDENMTRLVTSVREGRAAVEHLADYEPDVIKVFADGWRYGNPTNNNNMNVNALAAIVEQAGAQQLPVVTHTVTVDGAKVAATAGVTAIVHAIQDRTVDDELIELMLGNNVFYAPTLAVYEPRPDKTVNNSAAEMQIIMHRQGLSRANLQRLAQAGVPVALGTDSGISATPFGESSLRELELLVDFGLSATEALIAGTANSAAVLGLKEDRGTIEVGKRADFVLVRGQPWQNISDYRQSEYVFIDGTMVAKAGELVAQQGPAIPTPAVAQPLIDDFEREDGLTAGMASRLADIDNGFPRSALIAQQVPRDRDGYALQLSARMALKESPKALVVLPMSPGGFVPVDATAFNGIRFDVRGDGGSYVVELSSTTGVVSQLFDADSSWQTIEIPFEAFEPQNQDAALTPGSIFSVSIGARRVAGETFWMELDNVIFN